MPYPTKLIFVLKSARAVANNLPEGHAAYFDLDIPHTVLPVSTVHVRARAKDGDTQIAKAVDILAHARAGGEKCAPVTVYLRTDGTHELANGHDVFGAAQQLGWKTVPAHVVDDADIQKALRLRKSQTMAMPPHIAPTHALSSPPAISQHVNAPSHSASGGGSGAPPTPPVPAAGGGSDRPPVYKPEPLFKHGETEMPKPSQPTNDPGELWQQAHHAHTELQEALDRGKGYSAAAGHLPVVDYGNRPNKDAQPAEHERFQANAHAAAHGEGGAVLFGPMKDRARAEVKAASDRKHPDDPLPMNSVLDISRATVMANKHHDLHEAIAHVHQHMNAHGFELVRAKDKYQKPEDTGYRNVLTNWRHKPTGHVVEVQFSDKDMEHAKHAEGHKHYEETRKIDDRMKTEGRNEMTPAERSTYEQHLAQQHRIYGAAWDRQLAKHAHLAKSIASVETIVQSGVRFGRKALRHIMNGISQRSDGTAYVGHYIYGDGSPAIWKRGHVAQVWSSDHWRPVYDSGHFREEAEKISDDKFKRLLAEHHAYDPGPLGLDKA